MSVCASGNPLQESREICDRIQKARDAQLIEVIRSLEARKELRQENALTLMVLGDGEAGMKKSFHGFG